MKRKINRTYHPKPNWLGWIKWQTVHNVENIGCCDCGLFHLIQFRNHKNRLEWRAKRNKKSTKENRKKFNYKFKKI